MKTVQPSLAETIRQAHVALRKDLDELAAAARAPAGMADLGARLERTRTHLAAHFRCEEENGYMDGVLKRDPNRERIVQHLHADHQRLAESLNALVAAAGRGPDAALRAEVLSWVESVRDHETREDRLVQDVFNVDLSAVD
jgi:hypothetical protein